MNEYKYNPWPLNQVPKEFQRPELDKLKEMGYKFDDPREVVDICEKKIADFFGAKYCVTTDCCSHAVFLSLKYLLHKRELVIGDEIRIPKHTYISIPMQIHHANLFVKFVNQCWCGYYQLFPSRVVDAAVIWERDTYIPDTLMCLSFQIKKAIPTGKMGAILTDDEEAAQWLKLASYDGRDLKTPYDSPDHVKMVGWHMYATPEDCARTIYLMDNVKTEGRYLGSENYPDVSKMMANI